MSIIDELREESDLCRNETAVDVANLLDKAANTIERMRAALNRTQNFVCGFDGDLCGEIAEILAATRVSNK